MMKKRIFALFLCVAILFSQVQIAFAHAQTYTKQRQQAKTEHASECTVTLNPSGGTLDNNQRLKKLKAGEQYGQLPTPKREGYIFLGWFYKDEQQTNAKEIRVESASIVSSQKDHELYAKWKAESGVSVDELSLSFRNHIDSFQYDKNYVFPLERYRQVFGNNAQTNAYYNVERQHPWRGSCYGMSVLSILLYQGEGSFPSLRDFKSTAQKISDLKANNSCTLKINDKTVTLTLTQLIEALHITQRSYTIQRLYVNNSNQYDALIQQLDPIQKDGIYPLLIGMFCNGGGHAVVGYRYFENESEVRIMVYDSNFPNDDNRFITLKKNSFGQFEGWHYRMNRESWGTEYDPSSYITFVPYTDIYQTWSNIGKIKSPDSYQLLALNVRNATVLDNSGVKFAVIRDGVLDRQQSSRETFQTLDLSVLAEDTSFDEPAIAYGDEIAPPVREVDDVSVWVRNGKYTIINEEAGQSLRVTMAHVDQSLTVETDSKEVSVLVYDGACVNGVEISEPNKAYSVKLYSTLQNTEPEVTVAGITGENVSASEPTAAVQYQGRMYSDNMDYSYEPGAYQLIERIAKEIDPDVFTRNTVITDVSPDMKFYAPVLWAVNNGITGGTKTQVIDNKIHLTFSPNAPCNRKQIIMFLWRAQNRPTSELQNPFADVEGGDDFAKAAVWAYEANLVQGSWFSGYEPCTRSQVVRYLWELAGRPVTDDLSSVVSRFWDVNPDDENAKAIAWAINRGITNGVTEDSFAPDGVCTRGQIMTFIYRDRMAK